jgi:hypothetical protein
MSFFTCGDIFFTSVESLYASPNTCRNILTNIGANPNKVLSRLNGLDASDVESQQWIFTVSKIAEGWMKGIISDTPDLNDFSAFERGFSRSKATLKKDLLQRITISGFGKVAKKIVDDLTKLNAVGNLQAETFIGKLNNLVRSAGSPSFSSANNVAQFENTLKNRGVSFNAQCIKSLDTTKPSKMTGAVFGNIGSDIVGLLEQVSSTDTNDILNTYLIFSNDLLAPTFSSTALLNSGKVNTPSDLLKEIEKGIKPLAESGDREALLNKARIDLDALDKAVEDVQKDKSSPMFAKPKKQILDELFNILNIPRSGLLIDAINSSLAAQANDLQSTILLKDLTKASGDVVNSDILLQDVILKNKKIQQTLDLISDLETTLDIELNVDVEKLKLFGFIANPARNESRENPLRLRSNDPLAETVRIIDRATPLPTTASVSTPKKGPLKRLLGKAVSKLGKKFTLIFIVSAIAAISYILSYLQETKADALLDNKNAHEDIKSTLEQEIRKLREAKTDPKTFEDRYKSYKSITGVILKHFENEKSVLFKIDPAEKGIFKSKRKQALDLNIRDVNDRERFYSLAIESIQVMVKVEENAINTTKEKIKRADEINPQRLLAEFFEGIGGQIDQLLTGARYAVIGLVSFWALNKAYTMYKGESQKRSLLLPQVEVIEDLGEA